MTIITRVFMLKQMLLCFYGLFFISCFVLAASRVGEVKRVTKETNVHVKLNLDGSGVAKCGTGIPFLDHMLDVSSL